MTKMPEHSSHDDGPASPQGWSVMPLGEVAKVQLGKMLDKARATGVRLPYLRNINVRWGKIDTSDLFEMPFRDEELERFGIRDGDVLVCEGGEPGRAAVWQGGATELKYQKALHRVRLPSGILPHWLVHSLYYDSVQGSLAKQFTGTTIAHLTGEAIKEYPLRVAPLTEQARVLDAVASYFTRLDDAVATLERVERNLKRYRASVLKSAVEGRLVPTEATLAKQEGRDYEPASVLLERILNERRRRWSESGKKGKYQEAPAATSTNLPDLPEGWCWASIQQLAKPFSSSICAGPFGTIFKARDFRPSGVPIIFLRHVKPDRYLLRKPTFMGHEKWIELFQEYSVHGGELLVTKLGDPPGDCAMYPVGLRPAMLTPDIMKMEVDESLVIPRYVLHYLNSSLARRFVFGAAFGTTRLRLTIPLFRNTPVPLPPLAEQARIVPTLDRQLTLIDKQEYLAQTAEAGCQRLRQAVLKWAFEGKLADQDPNDEPASVLLERIKAERDTAKPAKTTRPQRVAGNRVRA